MRTTSKKRPPVHICYSNKGTPDFGCSWASYWSQTVHRLKWNVGLENYICYCYDSCPGPWPKIVKNHCCGKLTFYTCIVVNWPFVPRLMPSQSIAIGSFLFQISSKVWLDSLKTKFNNFFCLCCINNILFTIRIRNVIIKIHILDLNRKLQLRFKSEIIYSIEFRHAQHTARGPNVARECF